MLLRAPCAAVLLSILVAGLWPFRAPRNEVRWSKTGLLFGRHGSIVSAGAFPMKQAPADKSCALEIWLDSSRVDTEGTILAYYWPAGNFVPFALRQWHSGLVLERENPGPGRRKESVYVPGVFGGPQAAFVTISAGEAGSTIYVNGRAVKRAPAFALASRDLTGQLILGNNPWATNNWSGQVRRFAVYDRELSAAEVAQNANSAKNDRTINAQTINGRPDLLKSAGMVAGYLFDEQKGNSVHNQMDSAPDLIIPERFFVLHKPFLERPWDEFRPRWQYWTNVGINIGGFIPLGFFFGAYFSAMKITRSTWLTIALGFIVSLSIEVLQFFLPTRESGMTDLLTNTFGTTVGAILYAEVVRQNWFARIGAASALSLRSDGDP